MLIWSCLLVEFHDVVSLHPMPWHCAFLKGNIDRLVLKHGTPERRNTKTRNTKLLKPGTPEK